MAKKRQESSSTDELPEKPVKKKKPAKKRASGELPWHPVWRWLVSLLVVLHLLAVFSAPWDLATTAGGGALPPGYEARRPPRPLPPPNSPVWQMPIVTQGLHAFFHDYLNLLYLNHGYEFFAPDPAGSHIIDYQVTKSDGKVVEGRLPSHEEHWPRLLYHRHMMLADQTLMPVLGPASGQHYADHLATIHGGSAKLQLKAHFLLSPQQVADEMPLDAPSTFQLISEVYGSPRQKPAEQPAPQPGAQQ